MKDIRRNEVCRVDVEGEGASKILGVMGDERKRRQEEGGEGEGGEASGTVVRKVKEGAEDGVSRTVVHRRDRG